MTLKLFILALLQLGLSLVLVILVTFLTFKMIKLLIMKKHGITYQNKAFAWLAAGIIFSVGYMVSGVIQPLLHVLRILDNSDKDTTVVIGQIVLYSLLFIGLGFVIAFLVVLAGMYIFNWLNSTVDELKEIAQNNEAVGIIVGVIVIVVAVLVKDSAVMLLESMIPYPTVPMIR
ncbi:MAG: DUF350 domain-containing protein [Thermonemataceae bacterium]